MTPPEFTEVDHLTELYAISEKENRDLKRKLHRLEKERAGVNADSPDAKEVQELLDLWWERVKHSNPNTAHDLASTRAAKVRSTLKRRKNKAKLDGLPESYGLLMCRKAIIGCTCDPWAMGQNPKSGGKAFNDIAEHILNTDHDVEKFAALFDDWCSHLTVQRLPKPEAVQLQQHRTRLEQKATQNRERWVREERQDPAEAVLAALTRGGWQWRVTPRDGWEAQCPAHNGTDLNLSIDWNGDGDRLLMKCWSHGCETPYVMDALGLPLWSLFRRPREAA